MKIQFSKYSEIPTNILEQSSKGLISNKYFICPDAFEDWLAFITFDGLTYKLHRARIVKENWAEIPTVEKVIEYLNLEKLDIWDITEAFEMQDLIDKLIPQLEFA